MTVQTDQSKIVYTGDGFVTVFAYPFLVFEAAHLMAYVDDVLIDPGQYTVDGLGQANGGNVTFNTAPGAGLSVVLLREVPNTQLIDYQPFDPFPSETHERALDLAAMGRQQGEERFTRTIELPPSYQGDNTPSPVLPSAFLGTDANTNLVWYPGEAGNPPTVHTTLAGRDLPNEHPDTAIQNTSKAPGASVNDALNHAYSSTRNFFLNPDFEFWQRGTAFANVSPNTYTADRWHFGHQGADSDQVTVQQSIDVPDSSVRFSLEMLCANVAGAAPSGGAFRGLQYRMSGYDHRQFEWGSAQPLSIRLYFWVKSSLTGNLPVTLRHPTDGVYQTLVAINQANTWQRVVLDIPAGTGFPWEKEDKLAMDVSFSIWNSPSSDSPSVLNTWTSGQVNTNATGINLLGLISSYIRFADMRMSIGAAPDSRIPVDHAQQIHALRRYYQRITIADAQTAIGSGQKSATNESAIALSQVTDMWRTPAVSFSALGDFFIRDQAGTARGAASILIRNGGGTVSPVTLTVGTSLDPADGPCSFIVGNSVPAWIALESEL